MNGIEKIIQRITEDTDREIAGIQAQAKEQTDAINADYAERVRVEAEEGAIRGKTAAQDREDNLGRMAQMEAKKQTLAAKQKMLNRAFDLALEKLGSLPEADYIKLLADLAAKAARSGKEEIILSKKDHDGVGAAVVTAANALLGEKGKLTLAAQTRESRGGLILSDGEIEANCTFETLLRLQETEIAGEIANVLFQ